MKIAEWIPSDWATAYPDVDIVKAVRRACYYCVDDCYRSQKEEGVSAFNKIKHGGLLIPNGRRLFKNHPEGPAAIFLTQPRNPEPQENPVTLLTITMSDEAIERRRRQIFFVQSTIRLFVLLFVLKNHASAIEARGIKPALQIFADERLSGVLQFAKQLGSTPWEPGRPADDES